MNRTFPHRARGLTLVEVLVALVVLAIGLLGLAALQARALKFNHDANVRTQATIVANDILERLRMAGPAGAPNYLRAAGDAATACDVNVSNPDNDRGCWLDSVRALLPGGDFTIAQNGTLFTVTLSWDDRDTQARKQQVWVIEP